MKTGKYKGPLTKGKIPKKVQRAYWIWLEQRRRCINPKHPRYATYGAKKVRVEYSSKDFIGWYLDAVKTCSIKNPHVGRIDHRKNYTFDNIELQSASANADEVHARYGGGAAAKLNKKKVGRIRELLVEGKLRQHQIAARFGVCRDTISLIKRNKIWR